MQNRGQYLDLVISEIEPSTQFSTAKHYRKCTLSKKGALQFINLQLPEHVQETILAAYESGKEVRIFA
jgi:hypothetical protein